MKRVAYYVQGIWLQNLIWSFMPLTATLIIISFSSPTLSFIPDLNPSFSANPSHCSLSFSSCVIPCGMWVPVAVWQPCELLYTCYLLNYDDAKQLDEKSLNVPCIWHCTNDEILHETAVNLAVFSWLPILCGRVVLLWGPLRYCRSSVVLCNAPLRVLYGI